MAEFKEKSENSLERTLIVFLLTYIIMYSSGWEVTANDANTFKLIFFFLLYHMFSGHNYMF